MFFHINKIVAIIFYVCNKSLPKYVLLRKGFFFFVATKFIFSTKVHSFRYIKQKKCFTVCIHSLNRKRQYFLAHLVRIY